MWVSGMKSALGFGSGSSKNRNGSMKLERRDSGIEIVDLR